MDDTIGEEYVCASRVLIFIPSALWSSISFGLVEISFGIGVVFLTRGFCLMLSRARLIEKFLRNFSKDKHLDALLTNGQYEDLEMLADATVEDLQTVVGIGPGRTIHKHTRSLHEALGKISVVHYVFRLTCIIDAILSSIRIVLWALAVKISLHTYNQSRHDSSTCSLQLNNSIRPTWHQKSEGGLADWEIRSAARGNLSAGMSLIDTVMIF